MEQKALLRVTQPDRTRIRVELDLRVKAAQQIDGGSTIDLMPIDAGALELSICAGVWCDGREDTFGQCREYVLEIMTGHPKYSALAELCALWERWHLNGMLAGTRQQRAALRGVSGPYQYDRACEVLKQIGLYTDRGYKYGHAWLYEPLPSEVVERASYLMSELGAP